MIDHTKKTNKHDPKFGIPISRKLPIVVAHYNAEQIGIFPSIIEIELAM